MNKRRYGVLTDDDRAPSDSRTDASIEADILRTLSAGALPKWRISELISVNHERTLDLLVAMQNAGKVKRTGPRRHAVWQLT